MIPLILAHGVLGDYDELIFLAVAVVFVALMAFAWFRSRNSVPDEDEGTNPDSDAPASDANPPSDARPDHFPLA